MVDHVYAFMAAFFLSLLSLAAGQCADTRGNKFVLGFMDSRNDTPSNYIYVSTSKIGKVDVKITSPRWKEPYLREKFSIMVGEIKTIIVGSYLTMRGTELSSKGILVKASDEVTVYGVNVAKVSTDAFLGLSTDQIGTEYFAVTHFHSIRSIQQFLIVGTKDDTKVTIRLTSDTEAKDVIYNGTTYKPGDTITLVINRYDTFQVQSNGDLTGSYVTSNKPISFFSGNLHTPVGKGHRWSNLVEWLIPVDKWGNRFATTSTPLTEFGDFFRIIASCSETILSYICDHHGNTTTTTLTLKNARDFSQIFIGPGRVCLWESDNPILQVQFSWSGYSNMDIDATMMMNPPIEQYSADYIFTTPKASLERNFQSFFIFIAKTQEVQGLMVDNTRITMKHKAVPKTELSVGYIEVSPGTHTVRHTLSVPVFGGLLYGRRNSESYGFPLGLRLPDHDVRGVCLLRHPCQTNSGSFEQVRQNSNIKSGAIWEEQRVDRVTMCASLCARDCKCTSYSYHKGKKICRGHSRYTCTSLDQNDNTAEEGWHFWASK